MAIEKGPEKGMRSKALALLAGALLLSAGLAQAELLGRDLDGDPGNGYEAFYDTELDLLWLDLSVRQSWGAGVSGTVGTDAWLASLNGTSAGYGLTGWRLPAIDYSHLPGSGWPDCGLTTCGYNVNTSGSEWAHLWYETLGNTAGSMTNTGPFQNLLSSAYWSGTEYAPSPALAWLFDTLDGSQLNAYKNGALYALAVRPGDVVAASVPEPHPLALALFGLAALWVAGRRRPPRGLGASKA